MPAAAKIPVPNSRLMEHYVVEKLSHAEIAKLYKVSPQAIGARLRSQSEYVDGGVRDTSAAMKLHHSKNSLNMHHAGFTIEQELFDWINEKFVCNSAIARAALYEGMGTGIQNKKSLSKGVKLKHFSCFLYPDQIEWLKTFSNRSAIVRAVLWAFKESYSEKSITYEEKSTPGAASSSSP